MTKARRHRPSIFVAALIAVIVALTTGPGYAAACAIDNTASLFAGGVQATLNTSSATANGLWATFTIGKAFASGSPVQFTESSQELTRSLSAATIAAPYRWTFGDGVTTMGHAVTHRYARPGLYRIAVYGYSPKSRQWFPFDNALVHIVPPGQVLQANLGYYALRALDVVMSGLIWIIDAALVLIVAYVIFNRRRGKRSRHAA